jgi:hypothetical protein
MSRIKIRLGGVEKEVEMLRRKLEGVQCRDKVYF